MKRCLLAVVVFVVAMLGAAGRADDLKAMEGTWLVEGAEAQGKVLDGGQLAELKLPTLKIVDGRYEIVSGSEPNAGTLKLDEAARPKKLEATRTEGSEVGNVVRAIYELDGDTLRICIGSDGVEGPTSFTTKEGEPWLVIVYKREK